MHTKLLGMQARLEDNRSHEELMTTKFNSLVKSLEDFKLTGGSGSASKCSLHCIGWRCWLDYGLAVSLFFGNMYHTSIARLYITSVGCALSLGTVMRL